MTENEDDILTEEDVAEEKKPKLPPRPSYGRFLIGTDPSVFKSIRRFVTAINLRIENAKDYIDYYRILLNMTDTQLGTKKVTREKIKTMIVAWELSIRQLTELKERHYRMVDEVMHDKSSDYRKLFKVHFLEGKTARDIAEEAGVSKELVQTRIYRMYCDFYDNDGIRPDKRERSVRRREMKARIAEARRKRKGEKEWKTSLSESKGK